MLNGFRENTTDITRLRLTARLEVSRHHADVSGDARGLEELLDETRGLLGATDPLAFRIECALEEMRSRDRSTANSADVWERLQQRACAYLPPHDQTLMRIRSFEAQYIRRRGEDGDVDRGITLYRQELERRARLKGEFAYPTSMTRGNLAYALLARGRPADLREAREILEQEVAHRTTAYGPESDFTGLARGNLGRTLLRLHESGPRNSGGEEDDLPTRALAIADSLKTSRGRRFGRRNNATLSAHLLRAHALLLLGLIDEARTEIRYVRAFVTNRGISIERSWYNELCRRLEA
ncbi:hypothetical protein ACPXB5_20795 [Micromonospora arida]|uniref:hypothetical protein n=1 Tax=Micromonospora arida TaxID=2203715 RepID=UPI003CF1E117